MKFLFFDKLIQDLRLAARGLRRTPGFTLVAVGSLALGIGANTAIFSFINTILLKRLPVQQPERLVQVAEYEHGNPISAAFSFPVLEELNKHNELFDGVFGSFPVRIHLESDTAGEPFEGEVVTGAFFRTLEVKPALGRLLNEDDVNAATGNPVCVLSYSAWQERFAGDPHIIGRILLLNSHPYRVIGVTERGFNGDRIQPRVAIQMPVSRMSDFMGGFFSNGMNGGITWRSADFSWLSPVARLRPGITLARAQAMVAPLAKQIKMQLANRGERANIAQEKRTFGLSDASQGANPDQSRRDPLLVLMGIVGLILLIACMNLANLLLAKAKTREKEFAVRLSLGAGRARLIRQLLTESFSVAIAGGVLGILVSSWLIHSLLAYFNSGESAGEGLAVHLDPLVLAFALALSFVTAILFGLAPAWQSTKVDVLSGLKGAQSAHSGGRDRASLRKALTILQLALSVCLLFAAGLLTRTLSHLETVDLGFQPSQVVALSIDPAMAGYRAEKIDQTFDEIVRRLRSDRSIAAASYAVISPLEGSYITLQIEVPGYTRKSTDREPAFNMISPGYFKTLNQPLLAGRDFSEHDTRKAPRVAIVNPVFAEQYFHGLNPLGRHFREGRGEVEIVGVAANSRFRSVRENVMPIVYMPAAQTQSSGYTLLVRSQGAANQAIPEIDRVIRTTDRRLPVYNVRTLQAQIEQGISSERILSFLSELFSLLATLLCAIGIYGIVAYAVSSRTREIGIRIAVGASRPSIAKFFMNDALLLIAAGIVIGIPLALASARLLKSLLFGLQADDPAILAFITVLLSVVGLVATLLPVRRAARTDALEALRYE